MCILLFEDILNPPRGPVSIILNYCGIEKQRCQSGLDSVSQTHESIFIFLIQPLLTKNLAARFHPVGFLLQGDITLSSICIF